MLITTVINWISSTHSVRAVIPISKHNHIRISRRHPPSRSSSWWSAWSTIRFSHFHFGFSPAPDWPVFATPSALCSIIIVILLWPAASQPTPDTQHSPLPQNSSVAPAHSFSASSGTAEMRIRFTGSTAFTSFSSPREGSTSAWYRYRTLFPYSPSTWSIHYKRHSRTPGSGAAWRWWWNYESRCSRMVASYRTPSLLFRCLHNCTDLPGSVMFTNFLPPPTANDFE